MLWSGWCGAGGQDVDESDSALPCRPSGRRVGASQATCRTRGPQSSPAPGRRRLARRLAVRARTIRSLGVGSIGRSLDVVTPRSAQGRLHDLAAGNQLARLEAPPGRCRELHDDAGAYAKAVEVLLTVPDYSRDRAAGLRDRPQGRPRSAARGRVAADRRRGRTPDHLRGRRVSPYRPRRAGPGRRRLPAAATQRHHVPPGTRRPSCRPARPPRSPDASPPTSFPHRAVLP
jgi:hypothetical protein